METPTSEQIGKLPKWARDYIRMLEIHGSQALKTLNEFQDNQKESQVFFTVHPCTGESKGPTVKKCFIQSNRITFRLAQPNGKADPLEIEVVYVKDGDHLQVNGHSGILVLKPDSSNAVTLAMKPYDFMTYKNERKNH
jgi:hypothetical protein